MSHGRRSRPALIRWLLVLCSCLSITSGQACFESIQAIVDVENSISDYSELRTYVLCPSKIYEIGTLDNNYELQGYNVHPPLPIRPNMHIKCGDTGSRDNLCWIATGDVHVDATNVRGITETTVENVVIEGMVFLGAHRYSMWATKPGDITFRDCEWREHTLAVAPILLDYYDGGFTELSVTFEDCLFTNNRFFGLGSNTALVYANSGQNRLTFRKTTFEHNDMIYNNTLEDTNSFLIETLGPLIMDRTCFNHNLVGVSNVAVFGNSFTPSSMSTSNSTGRLCEFAAVFETMRQLEQLAPLCVLALSPNCLAKDTPSPSSAPTRTSKPTGRPTTPLTTHPTVTPTVTTEEPTAISKELVPTLAPVPPTVGMITEQPFALPLDPKKPSLGTDLLTPTPRPNPFVFPGDNKRPSLFTDNFPESGCSGISHFLSVMGLTFLLYLLA